MERRTKRDEMRAVRRPGREGLAALLRKPAVQAVLLVTVVGQVVATQAAVPGTAEPEVAVGLAPVVVTPAADPATRDAWLARAVERESERLAKEYQNRGYRVSPQLAQQITRAAKEHDIEPELAFGLVRAESGFRNTATSPVGATGLTQLMPRTASWMEPGVTRGQLRDPDTNLRIGFKYLRYLLDKYEGDEKLALLAYNRGPGTVDRALRQGRNPDNGYADFVYGKQNHGHRLFSKR